MEDNGDIDGDIPADALEKDDEINSNIGREIPAEISETDDEMEAEELLVDQDDHLQGAEDVSPDEDIHKAQCQKMFQPTSDVRQDTARDLTDGDTIFMICTPSFEEGGSVAHAL